MRSLPTVYVIYSCWRPRNKPPIRHAYGPYQTMRAAIDARDGLYVQLSECAVDMARLELVVLKTIAPYLPIVSETPTKQGVTA